jgi:hypothetical protein
MLLSIFSHTFTMFYFIPILSKTCIIYFFVSFVLTELCRFPKLFFSLCVPPSAFWNPISGCVIAMSKSGDRLLTAGMELVLSLFGLCRKHYFCISENSVCQRSTGYVTSLPEFSKQWNVRNCPPRIAHRSWCVTLTLGKL